MKNNLIKKIGKNVILPLAIAGVVGGCNPCYETDNKGKLYPHTHYISDWDFKEQNKGKDIFYDIEPDLYKKPKKFDLKRVKIDGEIYYQSDSLVFDKAEKRIKNKIKRAYSVEDSLKNARDSSRTHFGLEALE